MADAALEGIAQRKDQEPEEAEAEEIALEDEKYLSAATLARLKELSFEEEGQESAEPAAGADAAPDAEPAAEPVEAEEATAEQPEEETKTPAEAEVEAESSD